MTSSDVMIPAKNYQIKIHGTVVASFTIMVGHLLVVVGDGRRPDLPGEEVREPAFGMKALWVSEAYAGELKRQGFESIDAMSVLLTHLSEVIRNNLSQLLSYKDMRALFDRLGPEYKRLLDDICPSQISYSGLQAVLSIRYLDQVQPSTPWEVVLYVGQGASDGQRTALADIFLGRAGGTVARLYGPAIGEVYAVRTARITLEHGAARKRIDVIGYLTVEAEGDASEPGDVRCGIPGFDHPGTELHGDTLRSTDPALRWEVRGRRNAAFATDFDYSSGP